MRDQLEEFDKLNAQLIAVDPHEAWSTKSLLKESGLTTDDLHYPLLADPTLTVSATYGVALQMRIHTELSNRPATFIIDREGVLRYERRAKTFADRPKPDDIVAELNKLK
ncbi:MAG: redoxin domain-containing protein [Rhodopirellula sp.]|nr:redoxin domain-containing protein [Rhodopirellula sp.]